MEKPMNSVNIYQQLKLLADWNTKNIDKEPEQVRLNITTLISTYDKSLSLPDDETALKNSL